ncbi:MAG: tetratricopeptide repeat protein [bacterium]|nr:tetratricopeptide repeat protein [bacterium]
MQLARPGIRLFAHTYNLWSFLFYLLLAISLGVVLATFLDYGITIDEPPQVEYGKEIIKWYRSLFQYQAYFDRVKTLDLERYGGLFETLAYPFTQLLPFSTFDTRHLINALIGLSGILAAYRLGIALGSPALGLLAALFLLLTPRYYGHMFNNPKDLPFAVFYLWSIYAMVLCLNDLPGLSWKRIGGTGLALGLALGTRVGGLVLFGYLGLFFILRSLQIIQQDSSHRPLDLLRRGIAQLLGIYAIAWLIMLLFWPTAQKAPLTFPIDALLNFARYGTPDFTTTFFEGKYINITQVPRYYAPLWLLLALPEFLFLGLLAGGVSLFLHKPGPDLRWALLGFSTLFPLFLIVTLGTPLYDGLRHFLFVIPPLTVLSAAGLQGLSSKIGSTELRKGLIGLTGFLLVLTLYDMVRLHPNEYVYFNRLFGGGLPEASKRYPTDYWENSHKQGVIWLDTHYRQQHPNRKWRIGAGTANIRFYLDPTRYEYRAVPEDIDFYLSVTREDRHKRVPGEIVHTIRRDGVPLLYIIRPDSSYQNDPFFEFAGRRQSRTAWQYMQIGAFDKALTAYQNVLQNDPQDPLIYHNIALVHHALGQPQDALTFSRRALKRNPLLLKAYLTQGNAHLQMDQAQEAAVAYRKALEINPDYAEAYQNLARALRNQNRPEAAIKAYRETLVRQPSNRRAHRDLGTLLAEQKHYAEAATVLKQALALDPDQAGDWHLLAQVRRLSGDLQGAGQAILKALKTNPSNTDYRVELLNVGRTHQRNGQTQKALSIYRQALQKNPDFLSAHLHLGDLLFQHNQYAEAARAFQNAVRLNPKDANIRLRLAFSLEKSGEIKASIKVLKSLLARDPKNQRARRRLQTLHAAETPP